MMYDDEELIERIEKSEYQSSEYEELTGELTYRVRKEIIHQLRNPAAHCGYREEEAILRGFDESATWHLDAARTGDFAKSIAEAVSEYLDNEREVYVQCLAVEARGESAALEESFGRTRAD